jgi:hypothetical protein
VAGGAKATADHRGYSGRGFVDGFWHVGASATFTVSAATAGTHTLTLRYGNATGFPRTFTLSVNGVRDQVTLAPLADWDTWAEHDVDVTLRAGENTVALGYGARDTGNVNVDRIRVTSCPENCPVTYEAEAGELVGGARPADVHFGPSGSAYVEGFTRVGVAVTVTVTVPKAGRYPLSVRYCTADGVPRTLTLTAGGEARQITLLDLPDWDTWGYQVSEVDLRAGPNTVTYGYVHGDSGHVNIDAVTVGRVMSVREIGRSIQR